MNDTLFTQEQQERLVFWTKRFPYPAMGLIEALREVQLWHRHVSPQAEAHLAQLFQVTLRRVRELVTFYPHFTVEPTGRYRIAVCRNLSCRLAGSARALEYLKSLLGVEPGETTPDGLFTLEEVECLGACDCAPAFSVNDELMGKAAEPVMDKVLAECRQGKSDAVPQAPICAWGTASAGPAVAEPGAVPVLTRHFHESRLHRLETYRACGGYAAWEKAAGMSPASIIEEVEKSNLRGMGGAGFPTAAKWRTVPSREARNEPRFLVANADESEPGCFKDRVLMERNPHALIEGLLIAARAVDADHILVFLRSEYARARRILQGAIDEAGAAGLLTAEILIADGADAYISGCDTALLETLEGKKAWPRQPPPYPTASGVLGHPTVVNNVETLMLVPAILEKGAAWFANLGVAKCGGTSLYAVSGHVQRPGVYEFPMGAPLRDIISAAGGLRPGRSLKAVIPGGTSTPVLNADEAMRARMDFESLRPFNTFLGAGGIVVLDDTADMVEVLFVIERFLAHESCGQCTPCREGSAWVARILERVLAGAGAPEDLDNLQRISDNIFGKVICALGDSVGPVCKAMLSKFRPDFERHVAAGAWLRVAVPGTGSTGSRVMP